MAPRDQRSSKRIARTFVMRVAVDDGNPWPRWSLVTTHDLSAGGALFTVDQPLKKGQFLVCSIHFVNRQIECRAKVTRLSEVYQKPLFQAGIAFVWADEKDRLYIEDFTKQYLERRKWLKK